MEYAYQRKGRGVGIAAGEVVAQIARQQAGQRSGSIAPPPKTIPAGEALLDVIVRQNDRLIGIHVSMRSWGDRLFGAEAEKTSERQPEPSQDNLLARIHDALARQSDIVSAIQREVDRAQRLA